MSALSFNLMILFVTAALFVLYWTLFRAHFNKKFKKPNDIMVHVPLPHLQTSHRKKTVYGEIRTRQFTLSLNHIDNKPSKTLWLIFLSGHGDALDVYDTLLNQLYQQLLLNPPKRGYTRIHLIAYDRIGYAASSSFNSVGGHNICVSPPTFTSITSHDRAVELLSLLMNIEVDGAPLRLFEDDLVLIGHGYGGLVAQSFLNVLRNDLDIYYPDMRKQSVNIKLFLMDSAWIGIDKSVGRFEVNQLDCYKDYIMTLAGLQPPVMAHQYPSFEYLKQINTNYEHEIVSNVQICLYYRAYGDQLIAQWNELLGFWESMHMFGKDVQDWAHCIDTMQKEHNIGVQIYNLYSCWNDNWKAFQQRLVHDIDSTYLIHNECVTNCMHYIHLQRPDVVVKRILHWIDN
eukprot:42609_1